jgi:FG-GAP-like repeat
MPPIRRVPMVLAVALLWAAMPATAGAGLRHRPPVLYPVGFEAGMGPSDLAVGDFDDDGNVDLVTAGASMGPGASVSVLLGRGDGTLEESAVYDIGTRPLTVAVGDFDEDGLDDIVVPVDGENTVELWLSNGDETFDAFAYPVGAITPTSVAVGDFDDDDHFDAAVAGGGMAIALLRGTGDGDLEDPVPYAAGGAGYGTIEAGDVNGDGLDDLLAFPGAGNEAIAVLLGESAGTLAAPVATPLGTCCVGRLVVGRLDDDDHTDLLVGYAFNRSIDVLLGGTGAVLGAPTTAVSPSDPSSPGLGDFDGDGLNDLVLTSAGHVAVHPGRGDGTFAPPLGFTTGGPVLGSALGVDLDEDGFDDFVGLTPDSVAVAVNAAAAVVTPAALDLSTLPPHTVTLVNDGTPPLRLGRAEITGDHAADFRLLHETCTAARLPAGASCTVSVMFLPTATGARSATLVIPGNGADSPTRVPLRATTPAPPPPLNLDRTAPRITLRYERQTLGAVIRRGIMLTAGCSEACRLRASLLLARRAARRLGLPAKDPFVAGRVTQHLVAAGTVELRMKLNRRLRSRLRGVRQITLSLRIHAQDGAGHFDTRTMQVTLRRR